MATNDIGTYGAPTRDEVQDPLAPRRGQAIPADSVPLSGVSTPVRSDFSQVGEGQRVLANLLQTSGSILNDYFDKKKDQWALEGQMAYAQGKTQQEIYDSGNQYTMAGFMTMKARTASNEWYQNALDAINNGDKQIDPAAYSKKLSDGFSQMTDKVAGDDPYTRRLLSSLASENFPKLVEQQVHSNNEWKKDQTVNNYTDMLISEATKQDPASKETQDERNTRLITLTSPKISNLPDDLHKQAVTNAVETSLKLGNDSLLKAVGFGEKQRISAMNLGGNNPELHLAVDAVESNHNPNAVSDKGAEGTMQVMPKTQLDPGFGVRPAQKNPDGSISPEEKTRVGNDYLDAMVAKYGSVQLALAAYNAGPGKVDTAIAQATSNGVLDQNALFKLLPKETQDYIGKVYSKLTATPGAATTVATAGQNGQVQAQNIAAQTITDKTAAMSALIKAGYTPAQIQGIYSAYYEYQNKKTMDFNTTRILAEQQIDKSARTSGNLPQALDQITQMKNQNGYSDQWANEQATKAISAVHDGLTLRMENQKLDYASSTNSLYALPAADVEKAIDRESLRTLGQIQGQGLSHDDAEKAYSSHMTDYLVKNNVVYDKMKQTMNSAFSGNLLNSDGTVRDNVKKAYNDYLSLSKAGSPAFANRYLDDSSKAFIAQAESLDAGGLNTDEALRASAEIMSRKNSGNGENSKPTINPDAISYATDRTISNLTPGIIAGISRTFSGENTYAQGPFDVRGYEVDSAKNDPNFKVAIETRATLAKLQNPNMTDDAAVGLAVKEVTGNMEIVGGHVIFGNKTSTIRQDMKLPSTAVGAVGAAMDEFLRTQGKNLWGREWETHVSANPFVGMQIAGRDEQGNEKYLIGNQHLGIPQPSTDAMTASVSDSVYGLPAYYVKYDADRKGFIVDLYANKERTLVLNNPKFIPAPIVGAVYVSNVLDKRQPGILESYLNNLVDGTKAIGSGIKTASNLVGKPNNQR